MVPGRLASSFGTFNKGQGDAGLALSVGESKCGIQQGAQQLPSKSIIGRCFYDAQSGALCQRRTATGQYPVATTGQHAAARSTRAAQGS
jgi:hypothetical protein